VKVGNSQRLQASVKLGIPPIYFLLFLTQLSMWATSTAITMTGDMMLQTQKASNSSNGHCATMLSSSTTQSKEAHSDQHDGNAITCQIYAGCLLSEATHYHPAVSSHTASIDHPSSTLVSLCRSYAAQTRNSETSGKLTGMSSHSQLQPTNPSL